MTVAGQITTVDSAAGDFEINAGGDITLDAKALILTLKKTAIPDSYITWDQTKK